MVRDPLENIKSVIAIAEFGQYVSRELSGVRLIHESDKDTLERMIKLALKVICPKCGGYGTPMVVDGPCKECHGTGERHYDPHEEATQEVVDS